MCIEFQRQEHRSKRTMQTNLPMSSVSHRLLPVKIDCLFSSRINDVRDLSRVSLAWLMMSHDGSENHQ